jgi:hypothetical protein
LHHHRRIAKKEDDLVASRSLLFCPWQKESPCLFSPSFFLLALSLFAEDAPRDRSVTGQQNAAGSQIVINEVNLDRFPTVQLFATVLKNGTPLKGLTANGFKVREDETDQSPLTVEQNLPPLSIIVLIDSSGSMKPRMKETKAAATGFIEPESER